VPLRDRVGSVLRVTGRALPPGTRSWAGRASRRFRKEFRGPLVSVVLAVSDDETTKIGPMLADLRASGHRNLEVLVVPYGRANEVTASAAEQEQADWRIRLLDPVAGDRGAARNAGAGQARGRYLQFVNGGDNLPPHAIPTLVAALERTGSDQAVGAIGQVASASVTGDAAVRVGRRERSFGATLATVPSAVLDLGVGNRLLRRDLWQRAGLAFTGDAKQDRDLALASYKAARTFDFLDRMVYLPTGRKDGASVGRMERFLAELPQFARDQRRLADEVAELGVPQAQDAWLVGVLDISIQPFLDDVERADDTEWESLRALAIELLEQAGASVWPQLRASSKVKLWLLREGRRTDLEDYNQARWFQRGETPTHLVGDTVIAQLPFVEDPTVPRSCFEMSEGEVTLQVIVRGAAWRGDLIELDLLTRIDFVHLDERPEIEAFLVQVGGDARVPLTVTPLDDPDANEQSRRRFQDSHPGACRVTVDPRAVAAVARPGDVTGFDLEIRLTITTPEGQISRVGGIARVDDRSAAGLLAGEQLAPRPVRGQESGGVLIGILRRGQVPALDEAGLVTIAALPDPGVRLTQARLDGRRFTGTVAVDDRAITELRLTQLDRVVKVALNGTGGQRSFEVTVPASARGQSHWILEDCVPETTTQPGPLILRRSPLGAGALVETRDLLEVERFVFAETEIVIEGRWPMGHAPAGVEVTLVDGAHTLAAEPVESTDDGWRARVSLLRTPWGREVFAPPGRYLVTVRTTAGRGRAALLPSAYEPAYATWSSERIRLSVNCLGNAEAGVRIQQPIAVEDFGPYGQERLREWALSSDLAIDPRRVYLQAYQGQSATDSQLAIHEELRHSHPELELVWGIADYSSWVPEGARPVVLHSRDWYEAIGSAAHLVMNVDFERWFSPKPGQRVLQTFHGYPAKSMGIGMWEGKDYTPRRLALELARTSGDWDLILTPSPEMDQYYRREYRYEGEIHNQGYPRADALVGERAVRRRAEARKALGIADHQKVVLYAPTWRDDATSRWLTAELVTHLDLGKASAALGDDYVLLLRGHRFHQEAARPAGNARLIDVTTYPEINDLILASDAAVLDYSSLRFDFALTMRPMVFLVPDLKIYTSDVRGFLYPFTESAPGPLLDTTDQVIAALRDLPALEAKYRDDLAAFQERYNYLMDGHAAQRVVAAFFGPGRPGGPAFEHDQAG
jgi:CDP-glycerol glycerophosphotransferase